MGLVHDLLQPQAQIVTSLWRRSNWTGHICYHFLFYVTCMFYDPPLPAKLSAFDPSLHLVSKWVIPIGVALPPVQATGVSLLIYPNSACLCPIP